MKSFKVKHNNKVYLVKATDSISAVKKFKNSEIKDKRTDIQKGLAYFSVNDTHKAYAINSVLGFNESWDENGFKKHAKLATESADYIASLKSKGYKEDTRAAYLSDSAFGYGLLTNFDMWVNSLDDINITNLVNYIKNAVKRDLNCDVAEIKTDSVTSGVPAFKFSFIGRYRNNKDSRWSDMSGSLYVNPSSSLEAKYFAQGQEKGLTKPDIQKQLKSEIANKLKQYANKTIYKDTSITRDSAVKDENKAKIENYELSGNFGYFVGNNAEKAADWFYNNTKLAPGGIENYDSIWRYHNTKLEEAKKKFGVQVVKDSAIKDVNQVLLSNLKQVAQKGEDWWNKWQNLLGMTDKWNFHQWEELRNNDPKKYELIIRNKQYAKKEAEALNREWDRAIDALSRDRSFGKPGDYRMDLHGYKSSNNDYSVGNIDKYNDILYGYEQAEKSARAKKGLDSSIKDGNNQLSVPKNLRVGSKIQTRNGTYTIIAIDNNDIATIQYENGRKFKLALYDIIDELDNVYTTKIIK